VSRARFEQGVRTGQLEKCLFERGGAGLGEQRGNGVTRDQSTLVQHNNTVGELLNFSKSVRGEKQRGARATKNFAGKKTPELRGSQGVEASRGLVEQQTSADGEARAPG